MERITLKADTDLLRAILANDPELRVEISKAVLNNIRDDIVQANLVAKIKHNIEQLSYGDAAFLSPESEKGSFHALMKKFVLAAAERDLPAILEDVFEKKAAKAISTKIILALAEVDKRINDRVDEILLEKKLANSLDSPGCNAMKAAIAEIAETLQVDAADAAEALKIARKHILGQS